MADQKKSQVPEDAQKASSIAPETTLTPVNEPKKKIRKAPKVKKPRKKGLPVAVDVLIVVLLLAVIAGAVYGIYAAGKYFSTRYAEKQINYTFLLESVDPALALDEDMRCVIQSGSSVYLSGEEGSYSLGKVLGNSLEVNEDGTIDIYVTVDTAANYNYTLGYFVEQTKIAVGKTYTCRFCGLASDAVIVELQVVEEVE